MNADDLARDRNIASTLPKTWDAFFSKFGHLTAVQREAIPAVLEGQEVLVCAPTASGKTEAVCAPILEALLGGDSWTVLYVSPTRALVNDLYERLVGPCGNLGVSVVRRTGDHPGAPEMAPNILITTPESFDSLFCRARRANSGHLLASVRAVVLDEIHLLHGTPRGEQVRWLLERLRRLRAFAHEQRWSRTKVVRVVGLSATVDDPAAVVNAYLPAGHVIAVGGGRTIDRVFVDCATPAIEDVLPVCVAAKDAPGKILVFANTRKRVDALAHQLRDPLERAGYEVRAHHGSLARKVREEAEETAKSGKRVVLFATSTLEIGIDIGDVDLVVLDGPAPDVRALLQRIGRGNRRTSKTRVLTCSGSLTEVLIHAAMLHEAEIGRLAPHERGPCFAVARQQLASYIFQRAQGVRSRDGLADLILACAPDRNPDELVDHMLSAAELEAVPDGLRLGRGWVEAASTGELHSNIETQTAQTVVDDRSGDSLASGVRFRSGSGMLIGGQLLRVKDSTSFTVTVRMTTDQRVADGKWNYVSGAWFQGAGQAVAVRDFLNIEADLWPVVRLSDVSAVFHFGGARRRAMLQLALQVGSDSVLGVDGWAIYFAGRVDQKSAVLETLRPGLVESMIAGRLSALEKVLARPHANAALPLNWRIEEVRQWLATEKECEVIRESRWEEPLDSDLTEKLQILASGLRRSVGR